MQDIIYSGIQQIGIGVPDVKEAWKWYRGAFGIDIPVFEEAASANFMLPYTGGKPQKRHAVLAINLQGGGGFEIWQYTERTPQKPAFELKLGDLGIFMTKIKTLNVDKAYQFYKKNNYEVLGDISQTPEGKKHFYLRDTYHNIFEIESGIDWFGKARTITGGNLGAVIGVSDVERSKSFYAGILGYDTVVFEKRDKFDDFAPLPGGENEITRVLLRHSQTRKGPFSRLLGSSQIELIKVHDREAVNIFQDRFWGDYGFIHLCFDISGMNALAELCETKGYSFTVDSRKNEENGFDMGAAAGHFSYIEDPDGALIEFVETHKIPIIEKLGIFLNLQKRNREKALPDWMLKSLRFNRVKDKK